MSGTAQISPGIAEGWLNRPQGALKFYPAAVLAMTRLIYGQPGEMVRWRSMALNGDQFPAMKMLPRFVSWLERLATLEEPMQLW